VTPRSRAAKEWGGRRYPGTDTIPNEVLEAIGEPLLLRLDARDLELKMNDGHGDRVAVVIFQLGDSGQWIAVAACNLWPDNSGVIGARRDDRGRLDARCWGGGGSFRGLAQIPAAIEWVVARRDEW
jgi:hypothetical protein